MYFREMLKELITDFTTNCFQNYSINSNNTTTIRVHTVRQQAANPAKQGRGHDRQVMCPGSQDKGLKPEWVETSPKGSGSTRSAKARPIGVAKKFKHLQTNPTVLDKCPAPSDPLKRPAKINVTRIKPNMTGSTQNHL
jgi:hypothetical protein